MAQLMPQLKFQLCNSERFNFCKSHSFTVDKNRKGFSLTVKEWIAAAAPASLQQSNVKLQGVISLMATKVSRFRLWADAQQHKTVREKYSKLDLNL